MPDLADGLVFYVVFLLSTSLHEGAHAWVAKLGGDLTAYHGGQVSLSPIPHIRREPIGMLVLPLVTAVISGWPFGFASAPYAADWAQRHPKRAALMALAGPGANFALVVVALVAIRAGTLAGLFHAPESIRFGHIVGTPVGGLWPALGFFLGALFSLNLLLGVFNLIPLPPLDGSGAMPLLLSDHASRKYQQWLWGNPGLTWLGIFVAWQLVDFVFSPVFFGSVNLLYPGVSYH